MGPESLMFKILRIKKAVKLLLSTSVILLLNSHCSNFGDLAKASIFVLILKVTKERGFLMSNVLEPK